jgi:hypothetical protein
MCTALIALAALASACSKPQPKPADPVPIEAFLALLAQADQVEFAFERHAFPDTDREGLGHLTDGKVTRFVGHPNYSCYFVEGQAQGRLARYRICWVQTPVMRIADVDRL